MHVNEEVRVAGKPRGVQKLSAVITETLLFFYLYLNLINPGSFSQTTVLLPSSLYIYILVSICGVCVFLNDAL